MSWIQFSNYRKRFVNINFDGTKLYIVIRESQGFNHMPRFVRVTWRCEKFRGTQFEFSVPVRRGTPPDWKLIFGKLRISLAHGLNPASRLVMDKINADASNPNPIHKRTLITGGVR